MALGAVSDDNKVHPWFLLVMPTVTLTDESMKFKTPLQVLLTISFLFFTQVVFSASYTGIITDISDEQNEVRVNTQISSVQQEITLTVSSAQVLKLIKRLKIGDYMSFQATSTTKKSYYKLTSIDYIGLRDLLGVWNSSDGLCYHFSHFSQLIVYPQDEEGSCFKPNAIKYVGFPKTFKYFITANETSWDILVGDRDLYFSAEFYFRANNEIFARIFNTDTGKVDAELLFWR